MAQAVYDQHPLGDYLKDEAGEQVISLCVPGGDCPVANDSEDTSDIRIPSTLELLEPLVRHLYQSIMHLSRQTAHREFAERFTHAIILSPLLGQSGSTTGSSPPPALPKHQPENESVAPIHAWPIAAAILVAAVFIASGIIPASIIALAATIAHLTNIAPEHHARRFLAVACSKLRSAGWLREWEDDPAPAMLTALDKCVQAASVWDTVLSEAMALLETEERNMFYASSPQSPCPSASALRIAITSELNTATSTTDTLRSLFGPLTSPAALAPLTAMYGPPASPPPVRVRHHARYASISSGPRGPSPSPPPPMIGSKRSTWGPGITNTPSTGGKFSASGSYSHLGIGRRRTSASLRRSRFPTPNPLEDVTTIESDIGCEESEKLAPLPQFNSDSEAAGPRTPPRRLLPLGSPLAFKTPERELQVLSPKMMTSTFGSAALSTLRKSSHIQTTSLTALRHALNAARASRRHTAAHLLALRFTDGDSEYWEDVRSVLGLLSAGLEDSASRLSAAVENMSDAKQRIVSFGSDRSAAAGAAITPVSTGFGFAPSLRPRERFDICVKELGSAMSRANELATSITQSSLLEEAETKLEAIRRELGSALRQLERARAVIKSQRVKSPQQQPQQAQEEDSDVPALDASPSSPTSEDLTPFRRHSLNSEKSIEERDQLESAHVRPDDASDYLLRATSAASLPPPGIEQVFEADTEDVPTRLRPKSTLTRAERIAARRAAAAAATPAPKPVDGNWEVVKELKAVISEVGGRRRKLDLGIDVRRVNVGVVVEGEEES